MSIKPTLLLLLLICLSMHACSSRPLGHKHSVKHPAKAVKKLELHSVSNPSMVKSSISKKTKLGETGGGSERITEKPKDSETLTKQVDEDMKKKTPSAAQTRKARSHASVSFRLPRKKQGSHEVGMSFDEGFQHSNIIEGLERRARSVLGSTEETINSKENGVVQDVMDMDYEPPHRKPPIHNLSP